MAKRKTKKAAADAPSPKALFLQGVDLAQNGFLFDAIESFKGAVASPRSPYADDALFNVGLCYLKMKLYGDALDTFDDVIQRFPRSKIAQVGDAKEFGRTAAKARLGRVHAHLALGDRDEAVREAGLLKPFTDSYVLGPGRRKRSFHTLAKAALKG